MRKLNRVLVVLVLILIMREYVTNQVRYTQGIPMARTYWEGRLFASHYIIDFVADPMVDQLDNAGRLFEDNIFSKVPVKMVYSSKTNRMYAQAGVSYQENDDPVDNSSTRTPPKGPDGKYLSDRLGPWALIGQNGARSHGPNGAMHYGAGIQFHDMGMPDGTVAMCFSTAPGVDGETR